MDKMKFETPDMTAENIEKIAELFPNCVTEMRDESGKIKRGINFEMLKQMLSPDVVDGDECYEFTWVGKKASVVEANKPIRKTLRPCPEESKDWDITENLYIEGDNLEVLKLLQESYLGKVKMIYIDPPYNTGNDFIYADDFMRSQEKENEQMGMYDEDENRLFKNVDSYGRFHSNWCSMIYSRLMLARNLLAADGVIFISIDDNEQASLKKICDDVFGESNFIDFIKLFSNPRGRQSTNFFASAGEYLAVYSKHKSNVEIIGEPLSPEQISTYNKRDERGRFRDLGLRKRGSDSRREDSPTLWFPIYYNPATEDISLTKQEGYLEITPKLEDGTDGRWRWSPSKIKAEKELLYCRKVSRNGSYEYDIFQKDYFDENDRVKHKDFWIEKEINYDRSSDEIRELFSDKLFDFAKPLYLIRKIINTVVKRDDNAIILDFFSGSATTAHAVMQLNAEDNGHRKFIMVQLPETCDEQSEAYKAGYKTICEIGKERIRRAGEKIKAENGLAAQNLDIGFRVLKLDDSNMKDVYYAADEYMQSNLLDMVSNIKDNRNDLDLLFGCLIDWGLPLSLPYTSEKIEGCTVHTYNDGDLIACFDNNIPESVIREIAKRKPLRAVFRDSGFADSPSKINVFEIFKLYMPEDADDISKRVRVI